MKNIPIYQWIINNHRRFKTRKEVIEACSKELNVSEKSVATSICDNYKKLVKNKVSYCAPDSKLRPVITCREWLIANNDKYKTDALLIEACMKALNIGYSSVRRRLSLIKQNTTENTSLKLSAAVNVSKIKDQFDLVKKIKNALKLLGNKVIYEQDLRNELAIPSIDFSKASRSKVFEANKLVIRKKTLWGSPKSLAEIKSAIDVV